MRALRKRVRAEVVRIDAEALLARRKRCEADRSVRLAPPDPDGMTVLSAYLTHDEGLRAWEAVRAHAERAELRQADAFVDLLTGGRAPAVQLIVRASADGQVTAAHREPLDDSTVRSLVAGASAVVVRPILAPVPEPRYRPSRALRDYVVATQPVCRFPHCERDSEGCDLDHVTPYAAGRHRRREPHPLMQEPPPAQDLLGMATRPWWRRIGDLDRSERQRAPRSSTGLALG